MERSAHHCDVGLTRTDKIVLWNITRQSNLQVTAKLAFIVDWSVLSSF